MSFTITFMGDKPVQAQCDGCYAKWDYTGEGCCPRCGAGEGRIVNPVRLNSGGDVPPQEMIDLLRKVAPLADRPSVPGMVGRDGRPVSYEVQRDFSTPKKPSMDFNFDSLFIGGRKTPPVVIDLREFWITKGGTKIPLSEMTDDHITNCMSLIRKQLGQAAIKDPRYQMLNREVARRVQSRSPADNEFAPKKMTVEPDRFRMPVVNPVKQETPDPAPARRRISIKDKE